jgi:hypothetical protein
LRMGLRLLSPPFNPCFSAIMQQKFNCSINVQIYNYFLSISSSPQSEPKIFFRTTINTAALAKQTNIIPAIKI